MQALESELLHAHMHTLASAQLIVAPFFCRKSGGQSLLARGLTSLGALMKPVEGQGLLFFLTFSVI